MNLMRAVRPANLPERKDANDRPGYGHIDFYEGWNSCLDELEKLGPLYSEVYVVPTDAKIHAGRKLRDALLQAGQLRASAAASSAQVARMVEIMNAPLIELHAEIRGMDFAKLPKPDNRRSFFREMFQVPHKSFAHLVGHFSFAIACGFGAAMLLLILAAGLYSRFPEVQRWFQ